MHMEIEGNHGENVYYADENYLVVRVMTWLCICFIISIAVIDA